MKLVVTCLALTGCFYVDPINARPRVDPIRCRNTTSSRVCEDGGYIHRNDQIELSTTVSDPDGAADRATYDWTASACNDMDAQQCGSPYFERPDPRPILGWPEQSSGVQSIKIKLDVTDDRGAVVTQLAKFYVNDPPTLELHTPLRAHAVGAPLELTATYGDPDEGSTNIALAWSIVAPQLDAPPPIDDVTTATGDSLQRTVIKRLVPTTMGSWNVQVVATDSLAETNEQHLLFDVGPDLPPCLTRVQPIVPPGTAVLPIVEPTVFQVPLVDDDLDAYPRTSNDPAFGTTTFAWSMLAPGASARQLLVGATGNSLDFDPGRFSPGQIVELRVEIFDRNHTPVACSDGLPTCPSADRPDCSQRQTWRLEIR